MARGTITINFESDEGVSEAVTKLWATMDSVEDFSAEAGDDILLRGISKQVWE